MLLQLKDGQQKNHRQGDIVLAGDVGGTHTRLVLIQPDHDSCLIIGTSRYPSAAYPALTDIIRKFLEPYPHPHIISLGVAGPVVNGVARLSNINWTIDNQELLQQFSAREVCIINDLEATAYGLQLLSDNEIEIVHAGNGFAGNAAIIAPGTGLGEAGLYRDGEKYHPFATEGGHCDFAPYDEVDYQLLLALKEQFSHVSWERLVSGPGIQNIYRFLRDKKKLAEPGWLKQKLTNADMAAVISQHTDESEICGQTMQLFTKYLARESANLALKFNAGGGIFIGGGIVPHISPLLHQYSFNASFCQAGRMNYLLDRIPVSIILNPDTTLWGAASFACL
ncbi:MAG: glucokinase [Sphingobacteriales bacterium]|nr:glucokinase [Sphingobacteriales bacterium]OJW34134.1 MAG: glucokinase [Sphingobacteriales bacterium 46-32]